MKKNYWGVVMKTASKNYLGCDRRIIPIMGLIITIGSAGATIYTAIAGLWLSFLFGGIFLLALFLSVILAQRDIWVNEAESLVTLKESQNIKSAQARDFIDVAWIEAEGLDRQELSFIYITIVLINRLLDTIPISGMTGKIYVAGYEPKQDFNFTDNPPRQLLPLSKPISIRQQIILDAELKNNIKKCQQSKKPELKLVITIERKDGDPIRIDPSDTDPLKLSWRL